MAAFLRPPRQSRPPCSVVGAPPRRVAAWQHRLVKLTCNMRKGVPVNKAAQLGQQQQRHALAISSPKGRGEGKNKRNITTARGGARRRDGVLSPLRLAATPPAAFVRPAQAGAGRRHDADDTNQEERTAAPEERRGGRSGSSAARVTANAVARMLCRSREWQHGQLRTSSILETARTK